MFDAIVMIINIICAFVVGFALGDHWASRNNEKLHDNIEWPRPDIITQEYHYNCQICGDLFWSEEAYFTDIKCPDCGQIKTP